MLALVEPGAAKDRVQALGRAIKGRGYSAAEIELIKAEAPFANHYGAFVRLDVLEAIVIESRRVRSLLSRRITDEERAEVTVKHPEIDFYDFVGAGYNKRNESLWFYDPALRRRIRQIEHEKFQAGEVPGTPGFPQGWREIAEAEEERVRAGLPEHVQRRRTGTEGTRTAATAARAALVALGAPASVLDAVEDAVQDAGGAPQVRPSTPPMPPTSAQNAAVRAAIARASTPDEIAQLLDRVVPTPQPPAEA